MDAKEKWHEFMDRVRHPFSHEMTEKHEEARRETEEEHERKMKETKTDKSSGSEFIDEK